MMREKADDADERGTMSDSQDVLDLLANGEAICIVRKLYPVFWHYTFYGASKKTLRDIRDDDSRS